MTIEPIILAQILSKQTALLYIGYRLIPGIKCLSL